MLILAGIVAYKLRFQEIITDIRPVTYDLDVLTLQTYLIWASGIALLFIGIFTYLGLYHIKSTNRISSTSHKVVTGISAGFAFIVLAAFLDQSLIAPRFFVIAGWFFSIIFVIAGRVIIRSIQKHLVAKYNYGVHKLVVIGPRSDLTKEFIKAINNHPSKGYKIINVQHDISIQDLKKIHQKAEIDEIILTNPSESYHGINKLLDFVEDQKISYKYIPNNFQAKISHIKMDTLLNFPVIEIQKTPLQGWHRIYKKMIDIIVGTISLILFAPIMIISALGVKLTTKGPVFADIPERAGRNGKPFKCLKFRSMYAGAHWDQKKIKSVRKGIFKAKADPRITKVGQILRKYSIDELPQLLNVLKGDMSLVGPRPHFLDEYKKKDKKVWRIKPGITGLPQISGRSDLSFEEEVKLDTYYIENWSLWLDAIIILKTLPLFFKRTQTE